MDKCYNATSEELKNSDLEHYEKLSRECHHWSSSVPRAIKFYYDYQQMSLYQKIVLAFKTKKKI